MKKDELRRVLAVLASISVILAVTSCNNGSETDVEGSKGIAGGECPTNVVAAVEEQKALMQVERLESESRRLVVEAGRIRGGVWSSCCNLCNEICELPKDDALPLLDRLIEMAVEQPITNASSTAIFVVHEDLFEIVLCSFIVSQGLRANSFEEWNKIFRFFKKYTDEITAEGKRIEALNRQKINPCYRRQHARYLNLLQTYTGNWVHNARTVFSNSLNKGLTEEQKADILRRLDEIKKYTVPPPDSPYSKK